MYQPPFTVSARAVSMIAEISALIERYTLLSDEKEALKLRKANKIRTVHSSLAIEGNTLSVEQVSAILDGKKVVAPLRQIQEVKNALTAYDMFSTLNPFSIEDLLKVHQIMMQTLVDEAGCFWHGGVGVFSEKKVVHVAPPADRVPFLIEELFDWLKNAEDHLLIKSCVFHYEFEFIHPFADGNGRMGRFWQSLILARLHPVFRHLPIETMIHDNQSAYYKAISDSTRASNSGAFIDFMLAEILSALKQHKGKPVGTVNGIVNGTVNDTVERVAEYIKTHPGVRANTISAELQIPIRTLRRYLKQLTDKVVFKGAPRTGGYFFQE